MKCIFVLMLCIVFTLISYRSSSQSLGDYRSNVLVSGNWSDASSWEQFNGTIWVAAVTPPSSTDGVVTVVSGDRIDLITTATIDQVVVSSGGQLFIFNIAIPFVCTLANGTGDDIINNGTLVVSVNSTLSGSGTVINNSGATFIVRNTGTLAVTSTNNGAMQVETTGTFLNTTVTNNNTFTLLNFTLNLNTATFINHGTITLPAVGDSFIGGTGDGIFINDTDGTIFKNSSIGTAWIDPTPGNVSFTNRGVLKGTGDFIIRSSAANTGVITPGNNGVGTLLVSPAFITGKTPTFNLDIVSSGAFAGVNYDQMAFSNVDASTINISGSVLNVTDAASDLVGTVYTLFTSLSTITGTFATVHLPPTLGLLTYNTNTITVQKIATIARYTWVGGSSSWATSTNWSPLRTLPAATDMLTFNSGTSITITDVPSETIGMLNVTNNTTLNLQSAIASKTVTVGNGFMNYLNVDAGSTLRSLNNGGVVLNLNIANGSRAVIGGVADMQNGTFNVGDNVLLLHTTPTPLLRTSGQFTLGGNGSIEFGDALRSTGAVMTLTNSIFVSPPVINRLTVARTNGVIFGNQDITVNQAVFTLGNVTTNASGRIRFSTTATNPVEIPSSKVIGYAEMLPRTIGTAAINFLGVSVGAGANVGTVGITRITGPLGINTFNGFSSIAATWNITTTTEPSPARDIVLSWIGDFDNNVNTSLLFQDYRYDTGPSWVPVGPLAPLTSRAYPRATSATATLKLSGSWTVADQLNALPVVLGKFTGKQIDNHIELKWHTLSEINSDRFEIQRQHEGEEGFEVIGTIQAQGNSKKTVHYDLIDYHAASGTSYYRLKLIDLDNTFDYSSIVSVPFVSEPRLVIYPNPALTDEINVMLPEDQSQGVLYIMDTYQRTILKVPVNGKTYRLNRSSKDLPAGMYWVRYEGLTYSLTQKLIIH